MFEITIGTSKPLDGVVLETDTEGLHLEFTDFSGFLNITTNDKARLILNKEQKFDCIILPSGAIICNVFSEDIEQQNKFSLILFQNGNQKELMNGILDK